MSSPVTFIALGGFLGAGKTTTMIRAAQELTARGEVVAVVTNDQGDDLVDTATVADGELPVGEITGGCFCCRFDDLAEVVDGLIATHEPTVVLAEAVGSCTDLQSTVIRPLRALRGDDLRVAPLVVLVDPQRYRSLRTDFGADGADRTDLAHLYHHQLAEADVLALNKADTLTAADRDELIAEFRERFQGTPAIPVSAATGLNIDALLEAWMGPMPQHRATPEVDYDRYGAAEAELAWTNQVHEVSGRLVPDDWLQQFCAAFAAELAPGTVIGHVKVRVAAAEGVAKASLVSLDEPVRRDSVSATPTDGATVLVNARVAVPPERLADVIHAALVAANERCDTVSESLGGEVFRPGFPVPTHRM